MLLKFDRTQTLVVGLLLICGLLGLSNHVQAAPIQLERAWRDSFTMMIPCQFDDDNRLCLFDTGSIGSTIQSSPAMNLYPAEQQVSVSGITGVSMSCERIEVLTVIIADQMLSQYGLDRCKNGSNGENIVGLDAFNSGTLKISVAHKDVSVSPTPIPANSASGDLQFSPAGHILIPVQINNLPQISLFDTGSNYSAVDQSFARAHPEIFKAVGGPDLRPTDYAGAGFSAQVFQVSSLQVANQVFRNILVWGVDLSSLSSSMGENTHFILGYDVIKRLDWSIDFKSNLWKVSTP